VEAGKAFEKAEDLHRDHFWPVLSSFFFRFFYFLLSFPLPVGFLSLSTFGAYDDVVTIRFDNHVLNSIVVLGTKSAHPTVVHPRSTEMMAWAGTCSVFTYPSKRTEVHRRK
jgi:hypothetical protein